MAPEKFEGKKYEFLRKCFFREKDSLNTDKRQQIAKTIICIWNMFALLEISRIYKAPQPFADLQGPICY